MVSRIITILLLLSTTTSKAQLPVKWSVHATQLAANSYEIRVKGTIAVHLWMNSNVAHNKMPLATTILFTKNQELSVAGITRENFMVFSRYEDACQCEMEYLAFELLQHVMIVNRKVDKISGTVELFPQQDHLASLLSLPFSIPLK